MAFLTGEELSKQIDHMLEVEVEDGEYTLEEAREAMDEMTYSEIALNMYGLTLVALSLAHRVRELEGKA
jgi:hypothetical protein